MGFLYRFLRESKGLVSLAIAAAFISGATSTAVIALIHNLLDPEVRAEPNKAALFAGLCVVVVVSQLLSEWVLLRLSEGTVFELRLKMSRRILETPLRHLEKLGPHRLVATITGDVNSVSQAVTLSPLLCMYIAIIVSCFAYLIWLDWQMFIGFVLIFGATLVLYQVAAMRGERYIAAAREDRDTLFGALRGLTEGTKELKLNSSRRQAFMQELLEQPAAEVRRQNLSGYLTYRIAGIIGRIAFLVIFGVLLFAIPGIIEVGDKVLSGYILTLLYMNTPLTGLLNTLPTLGTARVAMRKIDRLGLELDPVDREKLQKKPERPKSFDSLLLQGISHTYRGENEDESFTLGPLDLEVRPGQILFLIGGNGSGKTTLAKILVGLYSPEGGRLVWDGQEVGPDRLEDYRQLFSMVFTNFYLFERLLGLDLGDLDERAAHYLEKLHLDKKVTIRDGRLSTTALSQGQRKRLALLNAYLEDSPIYVFDEWAADQDPVFKQTFYYELLPELRARGKAVVVISHDDHYYDVADHIVKLTYGQIEPHVPTLVAGEPRPSLRASAVASNPGESA